MNNSWATHGHNFRAKQKKAEILNYTRWFVRESDDLQRKCNLAEWRELIAG